MVCNLRSNERPTLTVAGIFVLINPLAQKAYVACEALCEGAGQLRRYIDSIPTPDHLPYSPILLSSWRYAAVNNGGELRIEIYPACLEALCVGGSRRGRHAMFTDLSCLGPQTRHRRGCGCAWSEDLRHASCLEKRRKSHADVCREGSSCYCDLPDLDSIIYETDARCFPSSTLSFLAFEQRVNGACQNDRVTVCLHLDSAGIQFSTSL
jgi:hypothetical protein